jgi:hypothetical protein
MTAERAIITNIIIVAVLYWLVLEPVGKCVAY